MQQLLAPLLGLQRSATIERGAYALLIVALSTAVLMLGDGLMRGAADNSNVLAELTKSGGGASLRDADDRTDLAATTASVDARGQRVLSALETSAARATTAQTEPLASLSGGRSGAARIGDSGDTRSRWYRGSGDTFTTVCVRLCDGWYRPVSYSTTEDNFERDSIACQSSCGSPARLYVYRNPGGGIQDMADLRGQAYARLKTAFLFQSSYSASCSCRPQPWDQRATERHRVYALQETAAKGDVGARRELSRLGTSRVAALTEPAPGATVERIGTASYQSSLASPSKSTKRPTTSSTRSTTTKTVARSSIAPSYRPSSDRSAGWRSKAFESIR